MKINFRKLDEKAILPFHATDGAAGLDLTAIWRKHDPIRNTWSYGFGLAIEIPTGFYGFLTNRSSIREYGLAIIPGVIDSDFRGEFRAIFRVIDEDGPIYEVGDRVAQLLICPVQTVEAVEAAELSSTMRGVGGFGSTGSGHSAGNGV